MLKVGKGGKKTFFFSTLCLNNPHLLPYQRSDFHPKKSFRYCFLFCNPPACGPVGVLGSLRINQPPTHSTFLGHSSFYISLSIFLNSKKILFTYILIKTSQPPTRSPFLGCNCICITSAGDQNLESCSFCFANSLGTLANGAQFT